MPKMILYCQEICLTWTSGLYYAYAKTQAYRICGCCYFTFGSSILIAHGEVIAGFDLLLSIYLKEAASFVRGFQPAFLTSQILFE